MEQDTKSNFWTMWVDGISFGMIIKYKIKDKKLFSLFLC